MIASTTPCATSLSARVRSTGTMKASRKRTPPVKPKETTKRAARDNRVQPRSLLPFCLTSSPWYTVPLPLFIGAPLYRPALGELRLLLGLLRVLEPPALHVTPLRVLAEEGPDRHDAPEARQLPVPEVRQDGVEHQLAQVTPALVAPQAQLLQKDRGHGEEYPETDGDEEEEPGELEVQEPEPEAEDEGHVPKDLDHRP